MHNKTFICNSQSTYWNPLEKENYEMYVDIPEGAYRVILDTVYDSAAKDLKIFEVTVIPMFCLQYKEYLEATTVIYEETTTPEYNGTTQTYNDSSATSEYEMSTTTTEATTTAEYISTTQKIYYPMCWSNASCLTCYQRIRSDDPLADEYKFITSNIYWIFEESLTGTNNSTQSKEEGIHFIQLFYTECSTFPIL